MKKVKGSVSLFTAMIFLLVASVITVTIRSARIHGARVMVRTASSMALDSVFSEYNCQLFSKFGVLLFDGKQGGTEVSKDVLASKLGNYMQYNLDTDKELYFADTFDLYGIESAGVSVDRLIMATEHGGLLWADMAVDYEKYAKPINLAAEYLGYEDTSKEAKAVQEISDSIVECTEQILKINKKARLLVSMVDGVKCPETGIDYLNTETEECFVKKFCPFKPDYDNLRINQPLISSIISKEVVDPLAYLEIAKKGVLKGDTKEAMEALMEISGLASECLDRITDTKLMDRLIDVDMDALDEGLTRTDALIDSNSEYLSDEVMEGLTQELVEIENYREVMAEDMCDVEAIERALVYDRAVLERTVQAVNEINTDGDRDAMLTQLSELEAIIKSYTFEGLEFNYSSLGISSEDTSILDSLSAFLENGVLAIVLPKGSSVSSANVPRLPDSASNVCGKTKDTSMLTAGGDSASLLIKNIIYTEYVMDNFVSFMDEDDGTVINYEVEYIICGEKSDKKNLTETVMRIAALRSGTNMIYLLTDSGKKSEAYSLAASMAGATAIEPVIKLLQYTILYVWAFAEGLSDVKRLFEGEKIELIKSEDTWNLSFDKLMAHDFKSEVKESRNGLDYEMFLRLLLYLESDSIKAAYTMDLVEFYMIVNHDKKFRLKDYVYGMEISAAYRLKGLPDSYTEKSVYTY